MDGLVDEKEKVFFQRYILSYSPRCYDNKCGLLSKLFPKSQEEEKPTHFLFVHLLPYFSFSTLTILMQLNCSFHYFVNFYLYYRKPRLTLTEHKLLMHPSFGASEDLLLKLLCTKHPLLNTSYKGKYTKVKNYYNFTVTKVFNIFYYTCYKGYERVFLALLDKTTSINNDSFRLGIEGGNLGIIRRLLEYDKLVDPSANYNLSVLEAAERGYVEVLRVLAQDKRVDLGDVNNQAIINASKNGHVEVVGFLLSREKVDPSDEKNKAVINAANGGHVEVIRVLLGDKRVDPSDQSNKAIKVSSRDNKIESVRVLLNDERVDPGADSNEALFEASSNGHLEIVKLLLTSEKVNPKSNNYRAIRVALKKKKYKVAEALLTDRRVDMNVMIEYAIQLLLKTKSDKMKECIEYSFFKNEKIKVKKKNSIIQKYPKLKTYISLKKGTCIVQ